MRGRCPGPIAAVGAALVALAALAPGARADVTQATCRTLWDMAAGLISAAGMPAQGNAAVTGGPAGCAVTDAAFAPTEGYGLSLRVARLTLDGDGLDHLAAGTGLPERVALGWQGLVFAAVTSDPTMTWLLREQSARNAIDGSLALTVSRPDLTLTLDRFDVDFPGDNALSVTGRVERVDASSFSTLQTSAGSAVITALDAKVTTHGLFEGFLLMPLGNLLLAGSQTPDADFHQLVALAQGAVDALPAASFDAAARAAMKDVLADLPHPSGTVTLSLRADPGVGPTRFAPIFITGLPSDTGGLAPYLDGVRATVTYTRDDGAN